MKRAGERGSSVVELALAIPFLFSLFLGTFQFGYGYYLYNELEQAVRAGARYASVQTWDGTSAGWQDIVRRTRNVVIYGDPDPVDGATKIVRNLQAGNVVVSPESPSGRPATVRVHIQDFSVGTFWSLIPNQKPSTAFTYLGVFTGS